MHGTTATVGAGAIRSRLREQRRLNPEWRDWLGLVELVLRSLEEPTWDGVLVRLADERPDGSPLLHGAEIALDARPARRWLRRLLKAAAGGGGEGAASLRRLKARRLDPLALFEAAIRQDRPAIATMAAAAGAQPDALAAVAQFASLPLLEACARRVRDESPLGWPHGYCPTCGGWPALAERRGLDRSRRLRCSRCAADWGRSVLHCPFCGEAEHDRQGALVPDGQDDLRTVETCDGCMGYVKTLTTLKALTTQELVLEDIETVELDIVALERGYARPDWPAFALEVTIVEPRRRPLGFLRGG